MSHFLIKTLIFWYFMWKQKEWIVPKWKKGELNSKQTGKDGKYIYT